MGGPQRAAEAEEVRESLFVCGPGGGGSSIRSEIRKDRQGKKGMSFSATVYKHLFGR